MPRKHNPVPTYRRQRRKGKADLAFVEIDKRRIYLSAYGSEESRRAYARIVAEQQAGYDPLIPHDETATINDLAAAFMLYAERYYGASNELAHYRLALRPLCLLYGEQPVADFSARKLKVIRQTWVKEGATRKHANGQTGRIKRMFKWGVTEGMVPPHVFQSVQALEGLRQGRTEARESKIVRPVPRQDIEAVKPYVSRQVRAMIDVQLLTGARPGEILMMRPMDLDMNENPWLYRPREHKTAWHGHERTVYVGPKAQEIIRPFLNRATDAPLFSPREAEAERHARAPTHRRPDQQPNPKKTDRTVRDHYDVASYRRAIERACRKAGVPVWTPHRLRHNAATELRKRFGIDAARVILGHRSAQVTDIYAELDVEKARRVIQHIG